MEKAYYPGMNIFADNTISLWIAGLGMWPLIVALLPNLLFRRYGKAAMGKRFASLYQAIAVFLLTSMAALAAERGWPDLYLAGFFVLEAAALFMARRKVFPYRGSCAECGSRLDFQSIYFMDDNLCSGCREKKEG